MMAACRWMTTTRGSSGSGCDGATQAQVVAEALAREAFHNVSYFGGPLEKLLVLHRHRDSVVAILCIGGEADPRKTRT